MAPDAFFPMVRLDHHHRRVPADKPSYAAFEMLISRIVGFILGGYRVHVWSRDDRGDPEVERVSSLEKLGKEETGTHRTIGGVHGVE